MAATFAIHESNTAGESTTVASNVNYGSTDSANLTPASYPITAGEHSYEKWERCHFSGTFNKIENMQVWKSAGAYKTSEGISSNLATTGYVEASYATPTTGDSTVATRSLPEADPTTANLGIDGALTGSIVAADSYTDYWVSQMDTDTDTPPGDVNTKTFTIQYDES